MSRIRSRCASAWRATQGLAEACGFVELTVLAAAGKLLDDARGDAEDAMRLVPGRQDPGGAWWAGVRETLLAVWAEEPKAKAGLRMVTS